MTATGNWKDDIQGVLAKLLPGRRTSVAGASRGCRLAPPSPRLAGRKTSVCGHYALRIAYGGNVSGATCARDRWAWGGSGVVVSVHATTPACGLWRMGISLRRRAVAASDAGSLFRASVRRL